MIKTKIIKVDPLDIKDELLQEVVDILRDGGLVIIPTETVYGIAANMLNELALARLRQIKNRPKDKAFTVLLEEKSSMEDFAREIPTVAYKLIDRFWPGPLTLLLKDKLQGKVGLRLPDNQIALGIIGQAAVPLVCPSANISGKPAPRDFAQAIQDLEGLVDLAVDAGPCKIGRESSILDLSVEPMQILREGAISREELEEVAKNKIILFICTGNSCRSVMAEALLKKILRENKRSDVEVFSAGIMLMGGMSATEPTKELLRREGIDVSAHRSQSLTQEMIKKVDIILVMERLQEKRVLELAPEVKNRLFLLREFAKINENNLDIQDPIGKPFEFYEKTFYIIKDAVERISKVL